MGHMKTNTSRHLVGALIIAVAAAAGPGCAWFLGRPPNEGAVVSPEGVKVSLVRTQCALNADLYDSSDDKGGEISVLLRVHNPTAAPVTIHRDAVKLLVPEFPAVAGTPTETGTLLAASGNSEDFEVRFKSPDELCCMDMDLHLDVAKVVTFDAAGGRPAALPLMMFGPSCE